MGKKKKKTNLFKRLWVRCEQEHANAAAAWFQSFGGTDAQHVVPALQIRFKSSAT